VRLKTAVALSVLTLWSVGSGNAPAQQIDQVIRSIDGSRTLIRPEQVVLSPTGSRLAICDRQANRVYIIDTDGNPLWTVGAGSVVTQPVVLQFEQDDALIYYVENEKKIFRAWEANPDTPDTVVANTDSLFGDLNPDRVIALNKGLKGFLVLDREKGAVLLLKPNWAVDKKLISQGSGKGRLWSPTDIAVDLSGNIIVSDERSCPVQAFTSDGRSLFCGSWNLAEPQRQWDASTVGMGPGETIWAADITNLCWRVFDRAGIQISQYSFEPPLYRPNSFAVTADNRMLVADDNGAIIVISLL
jgi:hypothetical protein